jgi:hypothetical protein
MTEKSLMTEKVPPMGNAPLKESLAHGMESHLPMENAPLKESLAQGMESHLPMGNAPQKESLAQGTVKLILMMAIVRNAENVN